MLVPERFVERNNNIGKTMDINGIFVEMMMIWEIKIEERRIIRGYFRKIK